MRLKQIGLHVVAGCLGCGMLCVTVSCQDAGASKNSGYNGMVKSTGKFNQGYQDGMREGQNAWLDDSGAWMWLWMMEAEYKKGYDRGWQDGRRIAKLKNQEHSQLGGREAMRPRSLQEAMERQQSSDRAGQAIDKPSPKADKGN